MIEPVRHTTPPTQSSADLRCPNCGRTLMRTSGGETVYLARVTFFRSSKATAPCPRCKTEVTVPLRLVR